MSKAKSSHPCPFTHKQIERKFPSKEVKKLCNKETEADMESNPDLSEGSAPIAQLGTN